MKHYRNAKGNLPLLRMFGLRPFGPTKKMNQTLQTMGLHKRIHRCLIDIYSIGEEECSPDPYSDVTSQICFRDKPGDDIFVFLTKQLEEAEEDFIDNQQYATRMTKVLTIAQQITESVLNTFIVEAFKLCGIGQTLGEAEVKTLQANCRQGGDFSSPTFSMCLCHQIIDYLLKECNKTEDGETKVEIAACTMIAKIWINKLKYSVLNAHWNDCHSEGYREPQQMKKALVNKFFFGSPLLRHSHLKDLYGMLSKTLKLKRSETTGDVEDDLEEMLNTEQVRRYDSLTLVRDVEVTAATKEKRLVKAYVYGGDKFAKHFYESITKLNDYCERMRLKPICPLVKRFDRLKSEIHMVYPEQDGWVNLASSYAEKLSPVQKQRLQDTLRREMEEITRILRAAGVRAPNVNPTNFMWCTKTGELILIDLDTAFLAQNPTDTIEVHQNRQQERQAEIPVQGPVHQYPREGHQNWQQERPAFPPMFRFDVELLPPQEIIPCDEPDEIFSLTAEEKKALQKN
eukprot:PhF_6_TR43333/c0_g2_i1/m.66261